MIKLFGGNKYLELKFWTFPGGERNVRIEEPNDVIRFRSLTVECLFKSSNDIIDILLLVNAVRNIDNKTILHLNIPYFPFARQDRNMVLGDSFALQVFTNIINSCNFNSITVEDPHSDVLAALFPPGNLVVVPQETSCYYKLIEAGVDKLNTYLVSPDAGALKKIYKTAKIFNVPVIEARKIRDVSTGQIISTSVEMVNTTGIPIFIILDDICDGGRTFIELAKEIRRVYGDCTIKLVVTHGIFSKGLEVLYEQIDEVYAAHRLDEVEKN